MSRTISFLQNLPCERTVVGQTIIVAPKPEILNKDQ